MDAQSAKDNGKGPAQDSSGADYVLRRDDTLTELARTDLDKVCLWLVTKISDR
jgi:hypothetical protein